MIVLISCLLFVAYARFAACRLLRYLHVFQQDDYDPHRLLRMLVSKRVFDRRVSAALFIVFVLFLGPLSSSGGTGLAVAATFLAFSFFEQDPRRIAKKKLNMTQRARRIYGVALLLCLLAGAAALTTKNVLVWIVVVQALPLSLPLSNLILKPFEAHIQNRIMKEASAILAQVDPKIIGITGSFGKTSVKHILGHILELNAATLFTPGSVNTLMGISRIIREQMHPGLRYFLVEMGAYGIGSIQRLCRLTPPHIGIITALGEAHYERFKTLDAVARAKFELAEAVAAHPDGKIVIHEDVLAQDYARAFVDRAPEKFLICGTGPRAAFHIVRTAQTAAGLTVEVRWQEQTYTLFAPLYGAAHTGNMVLAFAAALTVGVTPERAVAALRTVPQITHRLEVKPQATGPLYIDDAYNSNPRGFVAALGVLADLAAEKGGRRILVTPGIVELGAKHDSVHAELGRDAAHQADIVLVVRADRIPTFVEAYRAAAPQSPLHQVTSFAEAQLWLKENAVAGDIVLLENDLPDIDEVRLSL